MKYHIKEEAWKQIELFLKGEKGIHTQNQEKLRRFIEGVWFMVRSGCQWRLLPEGYGDFRGVHRCFKRWTERGIWQRLMKFVSAPDEESIMIDTTFVRSHSCAAGYKKKSQDQEALGRSKGGFTTKIHAAVDALGNPIDFILTPGQRNDITQAEALTKQAKGINMIADKGYDSNKFIEDLQNKGCTVVIPSRKNRKSPRYYDQHLYKERHLIECFFGKIKQFRRIFSRLDKSARSFLGFLYFVGSLIGLR